jgi:hypothetical protein
MRRAVVGGAAGLVAAIASGVGFLAAAAPSPSAVDAAQNALIRCDALAAGSADQKKCASPVLRDLAEPLADAVGTDRFLTVVAPFRRALVLAGGPGGNLSALARSLPGGNRFIVAQPTETLEAENPPEADAKAIKQNPSSGPIVCVVKAGYRTTRPPQIPTFTDCNATVDGIAQTSRIFRDNGTAFELRGTAGEFCPTVTRCAATAISNLPTGRFLGSASATVYFPIRYNPQTSSGYDSTPIFYVYPG